MYFSVSSGLSKLFTEPFMFRSDTITMTPSLEKYKRRKRNYKQACLYKTSSMFVQDFKHVCTRLHVKGGECALCPKMSLHNYCNVIHIQITISKYLVLQAAYCHIGSSVVVGHLGTWVTHMCVRSCCICFIFQLSKAVYMCAGGGLEWKWVIVHTEKRSQVYREQPICRLMHTSMSSSLSKITEPFMFRSDRSFCWKIERRTTCINKHMFEQTSC